MLIPLEFKYRFSTSRLLFGSQSWSSLPSVLVLYNLLASIPGKKSTFEKQSTVQVGGGVIPKGSLPSHGI